MLPFLDCCPVRASQTRLLLNKGQHAIGVSDSLMCCEWSQFAQAEGKGFTISVSCWKFLLALQTISCLLMHVLSGYCVDTYATDYCALWVCSCEGFSSLFPIEISLSLQWISLCNGGHNVFCQLWWRLSKTQPSVLSPIPVVFHWNWPIFVMVFSMCNGRHNVFCQPQWGEWGGCRKHSPASCHDHCIPCIWSGIGSQFAHK